MFIPDCGACPLLWQHFDNGFPKLEKSACLHTQQNGREAVRDVLDPDGLAVHRQTQRWLVMFDCEAFLEFGHRLPPFA